MAAPVSREGSFVIIAEFEVKPEELERFLELATVDASQSVAREPGLHAVRRHGRPGSQARRAV